MTTSPTRDPGHEVHTSVLALGGRFIPSEVRDVSATWALLIDDAAYGVAVRGGRCLITPGPPSSPQATITISRETWLRIAEGSEDAIAAFHEGRLKLGGDLTLALRLLTMFRPGPQARRVLRTLRTSVRGVEIESTVSGTGPPVVLLHGLGASRLSFTPTINGLAGECEVHTLDLPGFGASDKPLPAGRRYTMKWMARMVHGYMERHRMRDTVVVGNSMGGRIATELALAYPNSVGGMVALCPAVAFDEWRHFTWILRLIRSQWIGLAPFPIKREWVEQTIRDLLHDPSVMPPDNVRAGADELLRMMRDRGYRLALAACARHLATERSSGRHSYWQRLRVMSPPSLWIFGASDVLVSPHYAARVREVLPHSRVEVWGDCGHIPMFEHAERTNRAILDFVSATRSGEVPASSEQRPRIALRG